METTTFTCTKDAGEREQAVSQRESYYKFMSAMSILLVVTTGVIYYMMRDVDAGGIIGLLFPITIVSVMVLSAVMAFFFNRIKGRVSKIIDLMGGKEFTWNEEKRLFIYKDKDRTIRFTGEEVKRWISVENMQNGNYPCEIIDLRTGERIILEEYWNEQVHNFLKYNRKELGLPAAKNALWEIDIYKNIA